MTEHSRNTNQAREASEKALAATNEASGSVRKLYTGFLLLGAYVGIILAGTTHEQLLRESPVRLPFFNVEVPIDGFFILISCLVLLFHFNLLLQFVLVADKLRELESCAAGLPRDEVDSLRSRVATFTFVQMLSGSQRHRSIRLLLSFIVWVTVVAFPLTLLLATQLQFLPYHSEGITWGHRTAVLLDVGIITFFWPRIVSSGSTSIWWFSSIRVAWAGMVRALDAGGRKNGLLRRWKATATKRASEIWQQGRTERQLGASGVVLAGIAAVVSSVLIFTIPGRLCEQGRIDQFFSRNLVLVDRILTQNDLSPRLVNSVRAGKDRENALREIVGLNLMGRDLRCSVFAMSVLPKADLRFALLEGADWSSVQLQQGDLRGAYLRNANLREAELQGADLRTAHLQRSILIQAKLVGASLIDAKLNGADLRETQMQGVILDRAQLQGVALNNAKLQGASLEAAELQGADLSGAQLQGANLLGAKLSGAKLSGAQVGNAKFWSAFADYAELTGLDATPMTADEVRMLSEELGQVGVDRENLQQILKRIEAAINDSSHSPPWGLDAAEHCIVDEPNLFPDCRGKDEIPDYRQRLVPYLTQDLACGNSDTALGIAKFRALVPESTRQSQAPSTRGFLDAVSRLMSLMKSDDLAEALLKAAEDPDCKGVHELPEDIKDQLRNFAQQKHVR